MAETYRYWYEKLSLALLACVTWIQFFYLGYTIFFGLWMESILLVEVEFVIPNLDGGLP